MEWKRDFVLNIPSCCTVEIGDNADLKNVTIDWLKDAENSKLIIGNNTRLGLARLVFYKKTEIEIGSGTTMADTLIKPHEGRRVHIGNDCMFSWKTTILGHDGHCIYDLHSNTCVNDLQGEIQESVTLGDHIWVGAEAAILAGAHIGNGCIVGFRSLVKKSFPNNCIIAGAPAKIVRKDIAWTRSVAGTEKKLLDLPKAWRMLTLPSQ